MSLNSRRHGNHASHSHTPSSRFGEQDGQDHDHDHDHGHTSSARKRSSLLVPAALGVGSMLTVMLLNACATRPPDNVKPVTSFDIGRYAGRWYEIARTDQRFEKGLVRTQAYYNLHPDGTVEVTNRGFDPKKNQWQEAVGKARFIGKPTEAALKVSFFGPFYGGYNVVALDPAYQWALVIGSSVDSMWILSRKPYLSDEVRGVLLAKARALGVDEDKIVWVQQDGVNPTGM